MGEVVGGPVGEGVVGPPSGPHVGTNTSGGGSSRLVQRCASPALPCKALCTHPLHAQWLTLCSRGHNRAAVSRSRCASARAWEDMSSGGWGVARNWPTCRRSSLAASSRGGGILGVEADRVQPFGRDDAPWQCVPWLDPSLGLASAAGPPATPGVVVCAVGSKPPPFVPRGAEPLRGVDASSLG